VEAVVTPDKEHGGHVRLRDHEGRTTPRDEVLRELSKNLAGPIAQVLFADHTIEGRYRERFKTSILDNIKSVEDLNDSHCSPWYPDLKPHLDILAYYPDDCEEHYNAESFVRRWFARPSLKQAIKTLAEKLHAFRDLSGPAILAIVNPLLDKADYVTEEDIADAA
jgi:hypothetical protein